MGNKFYDESKISDIADAIRAKNGTQNTYTVAQMAGAIADIPTGGGSQIVSGVVNQNGTITFTDSDGGTFNTTGDNIVTSGNQQISMGFDNNGKFYFRFDDGQEV